MIHRAVTDGGGVPLAFTMNPMNRNAVRPANAHLPIASRAFVAAAYIQTPTPNITVSTTRVTGTEFHKPKPNLGPPGYKGMSGMCVITSSTQWLTTSASTMATSGRRASAETIQPSSAPNSASVSSECEYG